MGHQPNCKDTVSFSTLPEQNTRIFPLSKQVKSIFFVLFAAY